MTNAAESRRHLGLLGATGIGVGAIVGGGFLALAGIGFQTTGPSTILAFALNGGIALLTVFSFAELAARFPRSGGTYAYARRVLTVEAAFAVGWVVWFASAVAAVLYAMGFAVFFVPFLEQMLRLAGNEPPAWLGDRLALVGYALCAVAFYAWRLTRFAVGGRQWETMGKVVVLVVLILAGFFALFSEAPAPGDLAAHFSPFFTDGFTGLLQAMGYTFIALQGFDLITAVAGEVRDAERNVPKAMFLSLGTALVIFLPLLFLIVAVGVPGRPVAEVAAENPEILVAVAARNFMGSAGYWLVVAAGLLSMLSALQVNLIAASRFAQAMATDRTLPQRYARLTSATGTPTAAVRLTAVVAAFLLVALPNVAAAGAASSLVFLGSFALTHTIAYLARRRAGRPLGFHIPWFPAIPIAGGSACMLIGLYQAIAVPSAGVLAALWLSAGAILYALFLGPRARVVDASSEARDPQIIKTRGRRPLVLTPIANPASAPTMVAMAKALAPPDVGRVQLLSVVEWQEGPSGEGLPRGIRDAQSVLGGALSTAVDVDLRPEALITLHKDPWSEIARVAEATRCEKLLLGVGELDDSLMTGPLARVIGAVDADVIILRAPPDWQPTKAHSILVPSRGGRDQSPVRARLLGSLARTAPRDVAFLGVLSPSMGGGTHRRALKDLERLAWDEVGDQAHAELAVSEDVVAQVARRAGECDLLILGFHRRRRRRAVFSNLMLEIARATTCPLVMISHRHSSSVMANPSLLASSEAPEE
ncbi:MAG: amino acid permease [Gemmatimonadetes bacterium]|nr:amino acid permease [Gemmatimonadota bacterium]MYB98336.1 amino acid permease [Gemmatimonadota bacterium]MYI45218.1 amino acid permease [Gemmatimonadota bacterium]